MVAYSSLSGGTKRLAEGIFTSLPYEEKTLATIQEAPSLEGYDAILVGYWANQGAPGQDVQQFLKTIHGKAVGVFATLAYHPDTNHGWGLVQKGIDLVKEDNAILGSFVCNGALSPAMLKKWRTPGPVSYTHLDVYKRQVWASALSLTSAPPNTWWSPPWEVP